MAISFVMLVIFLSCRNDETRWRTQELYWLSCVVPALSLLSSLLPGECLKTDKTVIHWHGAGGSSM